MHAMPRQDVAAARASGGPATVLDPAFSAFTRVTAALETSATLDDLLRVVAREVVALVRVRRCSIHLRGESAGVFRGCVGHAEGQDIDAYVKRTMAGIPADGVTLELLRTKRPVIVANAHTDPRIIKQTVRFWNIHSMMAVPMIHGGEVVGIIHLDDIERAHHFTRDDAELATVFAHLAAVAVRHVEAMLELRAKLDAAQRQVETLRRAAAVEDRLARHVLVGGSLSDVVREFAQLVGKPCAIYDEQDRRLAAASHDGTQDGMLPRLLEAPLREAPEVRAALAAAEADRPSVLGPLPGAGVTHRHVVVPIAIEGEVRARLVVMEHGRRFSGGDVLAVRRAATLMALQIGTERRTAEAEWDAGAALTGELLAGRTDTATLQRRAARLGMELDVPRAVVLVARRSGELTPRDARAAIAAFRDADARLAVQATTLADGVAATVRLRGDHDDATLIDAARQLAARACGRMRRGVDAAAGISGVRSDAEGYAEAYVEARQVVECIRRFAPGPGPDVFSAGDLGAGRLFLATSDRESVLRFADETFGSLVRDPTKADLLATLRSFFDHMASTRRCALCLNVHENTIRYRLARIEELTGLAVTHDPDAQLGARLSLLVLMLQGRLPAAGIEEAAGADRKSSAEREVIAAGAR
jgi:sugar diacid utilization regulator